MQKHTLPDRSSGYAEISEYAMIGDRHGSALVCRDASIDWCCIPHFDSDPLFASLLDRRKGGAFSINASGATLAWRRYIPQTNVLETRLTTDDSTLLITDFMAVSHRFPDMRCLVRMVEVERGRVEIAAKIQPGGLAESQSWINDGDLLRLGPYALCATPQVNVIAGTVETSWRQAEGEVHAFFIGPSLPKLAPDAKPQDICRDLLTETCDYWREWTRQIVYRGRSRSIIERSTLTLKMMLYEPTGAVIAAPTTSLPEAIGGVRNWDYRYCWSRDSSFIFYAFSKLGLFKDAERFFTFFTGLCSTENPPLPPLYSIDGRRRSGEHTQPDWEGYKGSKPVRIGNKAIDQHQMDVYGQVVDLIYLHETLNVWDGASKHKTLAAQFADFVAAHWREPDAGLWEPRLPPRRHVHSAIMSWTALDRASKMLEDREDWAKAREDILSEIRANAAANGGRLTQTFDCPDPDASVLLACTVGMPLEHETIEKTCDLVIDQLSVGPLIYRYRNDDGLPGGEGAFLVCSFWLIDALLMIGRVTEAKKRFEEISERANDVGLFSEQMAEDGSFLGNFPQAFTHLGLIQTSLLLDLVEWQGVDALSGTYADRAAAIRKALHERR